MKRLLHLSYIAIMLLCLLSCNHKQQDNRPIITVSIEPLRYVVEAVAGDKYQVKTLMPQGASPETYEPTPLILLPGMGVSRYSRLSTAS